MVIIWGSKLYGKCDEVEGFCWVATKFGHLWYIPLIPMGTYAVMAQDGDEWQGADIPLSLKSILVAWLRTACVIGIIAGFVGALANNWDVEWIVMGVAALGSMIGSYFVPFITNASYDRACEIARGLGITEEGQLIIDMQYGRIDPRQAERRLERMAMDQVPHDAVMDVPDHAYEEESYEDREAAKWEELRQRRETKRRNERGEGSRATPAPRADGAPPKGRLLGRDPNRNKLGGGGPRRGGRSSIGR